MRRPMRNLPFTRRSRAAIRPGNLAGLLQVALLGLASVTAQATAADPEAPGGATRAGPGDLQIDASGSQQTGERSTPPDDGLVLVFPAGTRIGADEVSGEMSVEEFVREVLGAESEAPAFTSDLSRLDRSGGTQLVVSYAQPMAHAGYQRVALFDEPNGGSGYRFIGYFADAQVDPAKGTIDAYGVFEGDELTYFHACRACSADYPHPVFPFIRYVVSNGELVPTAQRVDDADILENLEVLGRRPVPPIDPESDMDDGTRKAYAINLVGFCRRTLDLEKTRALFDRHYPGSDAEELWAEIEPFCRTNAKRALGVSRP